MTATATGGGGGVPVPVCAAFYLILMVYGIGSVSGCHINPGVSTAVFTWGAISGTNPSWYIEYPLYVLVQVTGGICGGLMGAAMTYDGNLYYGTGPIGIYPTVPDNQKAFCAMMGELMAIFFFTFCILRVCCDHDKPSQATDGIVIGIALMTAIVETAAVSGGGVNPAVATSLRITNAYLDGKMDTWAVGDYDHNDGQFVLIYWIGPMIGGVLAASFHYIIEKATSIELTGYEFVAFSKNGYEA